MRIAARSVIIACTIALIGCGGSATDSTTVTTVTTVTTDSPNLSVDFTTSLLDGSPISLSEQLAQHPVALWFWAPG